ncbi:hypothetical protein Pcinc_027935 [Petrolisthes cinctipes]|uniref:Uncharacterized protein n=1 Tax=Petrolisthes cinctipes TaxID=88211 RepID=A0AAE1F345_PETCI|nr:hypothetical protein Pcinc_027935 [Petrolisthes cinctipes]
MFTKDTLRVLDVSGNRLTEMGAVGLLTRLQVLRASENLVCSLRHVTAVVGRLRQVREVTLVGNPVTAHRRYRPALVLAASHTLEMLDERVITSLCREFLIQAHRHKTMLR